jgi:lipid-A-disaccharide synthase-like uncharacterized protein
LGGGARELIIFALLGAIAEGSVVFMGGFVLWVCSRAGSLFILCYSISRRLDVRVLRFVAGFTVVLSLWFFIF